MPAGLCATILALAIASTPTPIVANDAQDDATSAILCEGHEESLTIGVRVLAIPGLKEGDSSMDGCTNIIDAMVIAQYTVGLRDLDSYALTCADTNDDGAVNVVDAMQIAQYTVDPDGAAGVLFKEVWSSGADDEMLPPEWQP